MSTADDLKAELATTKAQLKLLTSAEGLSLFTQLVSDVTAVLEEKSLSEEATVTLQARIEAISQLSLLSDTTGKRRKKKESSRKKASDAASDASQGEKLRSWKIKSTSLREHDTPPLAADDTADDADVRKWKKHSLRGAATVSAGDFKKAMEDMYQSTSQSTSPRTAEDIAPGDEVSGSNIRRWKAAAGTTGSSLNKSVPRNLHGAADSSDTFKRAAERRYQQMGKEGESESEDSANSANSSGSSIPVAPPMSNIRPKTKKGLLSRIRRGSSTSSAAFTSRESHETSSLGTSQERSRDDGNKRILGVPLSELDASTAVPDFVLLAVSHLEANGLRENVLFACSDEASINELEAKIELGEMSDLAAYRYAEVVAGLLRRFLMKLPEPLIASHLLDNFLLALVIDDDVVLANELNALLHQLTCRDYCLLRYMCSFVHTRVNQCDVPLTCRWRAAEQLSSCFAHAPDQFRSSSAGALVYTLLRLFSTLFEPAVETVSYIREEATDTFKLRGAVPRILLQMLVSPIWQDTEFTRAVLVTHTVFIESHVFIDWLTGQLQLALNDETLAKSSPMPPLANSQGPEKRPWSMRVAISVAKTMRALLPLVEERKTERPRATSPSISSTASTRALKASPSDQFSRRRSNSTASGLSRKAPAVSPRGLPSSATEVLIDETDKIQVALRKFAAAAERTSILPVQALGHSITADFLRSREESAERRILELQRQMPKKTLTPRVLPTGNMTDETIWCHPIVDVARELTRWDHELFRQIRAKELLNMRFTMREESPGFHAASDRFNDMSRWCSTEVLLRDTSVARAELIEKLIDLADELTELSNFQGAAAILMGLQATPVERLVADWEHVPHKRRQKFDKLKSLFDVDRNFQAYREALSRSTPPIVPYLPLISKYLFAVESHNDDFIDPVTPERGAMFMLKRPPTFPPTPTVPDDDGSSMRRSASDTALADAGESSELAAHKTNVERFGKDVAATLAETRLANCEKMRMLAQLIAELESYQLDQYQFKDHPSLSAALRAAAIMTEDELFQRSNLYRPGRTGRKVESPSGKQTVEELPRETPEAVSDKAPDGEKGVADEDDSHDDGEEESATEENDSETPRAKMRRRKRKKKLDK